jgi:hypothetical protein
MSYWPDIVVQDDEGLPLAWVEVKRTQPTSKQYAMEYYLRARATVQRHHVRYFLLVAPDAVYLWDREKELADSQAPEPVVISDQLPSFLAKRISLPENVRTLEYAVYGWLSDFMFNADKHNDPAETMLKDAGFLSALERAELRFGAGR